jgi:hypothetical protein
MIAIKVSFYSKFDAQFESKIRFPKKKVEKNLKKPKTGGLSLTCEKNER